MFNIFFFLIFLFHFLLCRKTFLFRFTHFTSTIYNRRYFRTSKTMQNVYAIFGSFFIFRFDAKFFHYFASAWYRCRPTTMGLSQNQPTTTLPTQTNTTQLMLVFVKRKKKNWMQTRQKAKTKQRTNLQREKKVHTTKDNVNATKEKQTVWPCRFCHIWIYRWIFNSHRRFCASKLIKWKTKNQKIYVLSILSNFRCDRFQYYSCAFSIVRFY